jgi:hypothetical protein
MTLSLLCKRSKDTDTPQRFLSISEHSLKIFFLSSTWLNGRSLSREFYECFNSENQGNSEVQTFEHCLTFQLVFAKFFLRKLTKMQNMLFSSHFLIPFFVQFYIIMFKKAYFSKNNSIPKMLQPFINFDKINLNDRSFFQRLDAQTIVLSTVKLF